MSFTSQGPRERIVCYCYSLTAQNLIVAIEKGATTMELLRKRTRAVSRCKGCTQDVEALLSQYATSRRANHKLWLALDAVRSLARQAPGARSLLRSLKREYRWRTTPKQFGAILVERPDLHSRVVFCNLECPGFEKAYRDIRYHLTLYGENGLLLAQRKGTIKKNQTCSLEARDLLAEASRQTPFVGQVRLQFKSPAIGSMRFNVHWYNENGLTFTHERLPKVSLVNPKPRMYSFPKVFAARPLQTYFALSNCGTEPYKTKAVLISGAGQEPLESELGDIAPRGSAFISTREIFPQAPERLGQKQGQVNFENGLTPLIAYYFVHNEEAATWQGQHF